MIRRSHPVAGSLIGLILRPLQPLTMLAGGRKVRGEPQRGFILRDRLKDSTNSLERDREIMVRLG